MGTLEKGMWPAGKSLLPMAAATSLGPLRTRCQSWACRQLPVCFLELPADSTLPGQMLQNSAQLTRPLGSCANRGGPQTVPTVSTEF